MISEELKIKLDSIEERFKKSLPLVFDNYENTHTNAKSFVSDIVQINNKYDTVINNDTRFRQCRRGKYRSLTDLYSITLSYFNISFTQFLEYLLSTVNRKDRNTYFLCTEIHKIVICYDPYSESTYPYYFTKDSLDLSTAELQEICPHETIHSWK